MLGIACVPKTTTRSRLRAPAFGGALTELVWIAFPVVIWVFWLAIIGHLWDIARKPEISFISVILAAECLRTHFHSRQRSSQPSENAVVFLAILLVMCALCLGFDIGQYEKQFIEPELISKILLAKFVVLGVSAGTFLWTKYYTTPSREAHAAGPMQIVLYPSNMSVNFYSAIASTYDARNSLSLRQVQLRVASSIRELRLAKGDSPFSVCDIGGGTGRLIAEQFIHERQVNWTLIDASQEMLSVAQGNFYDAGLQIEFLHRDILQNGMMESFGNRKFDAIVMSYLLSSLPKDPDWGGIIDMLSPDGVLIISDAASEYVAQRPEFDVAHQGIQHRLQLRRIDHLAMYDDLRSRGLRANISGITKKDPISKATINYGYIIVASRG
jgi:ubiquinone/menaquinone biosynthesis C-methylase UbiE